MQPGDRILAINGQQLEGMTLEDARSIIKESNNQIHLEIEFDVAGKYSFLSLFIHLKIFSNRFSYAIIWYMSSENFTKKSRSWSICYLYVFE